MAILMKVEGAGATTDQYDQLNKAMGIDADNLPEGLVSHVAGPTDDGLLIVDVWESQEALQRFLEDRVGPAMQQVGIAPAEPHVLPVHKQLQGSGRNAGVIVLIKAESFDPAAYDQLTAGMESHRGDGSNHPAVSHVAAVADRGMVFVDVWGSPEEFGAFAEKELASAADAIGPMETRFVPVHNHSVAKS